MSSPVTPLGVDLRELAERYGEAWNRQDLDAVVAMLAEDGTVAAPIEVEGRQVEAAGSRVAVDFLDVIIVEDGLIAREDSYLDTLAFERQLGMGS